MELDTRRIALECLDGSRVQRGLTSLGRSGGDVRMRRQQAVRMGKFRLSTSASLNGHVQTEALPYYQEPSSLPSRVAQGVVGCQDKEDVLSRHLVSILFANETRECQCVVADDD